MVSLASVRESNASLKSLGAGLVAIFVGGTSGIGETTARELVRNTTEPRIYLVGRNEKEASRIKNEFKSINAGCDVTFIQSDVTLLKNVDTACKEIQAKESKINLLFLSSGILSLSGRDETTEGLDKKFNLNYYSRARFTHNLMPLVQKAANENQLSRVVTVLAAGGESKLHLDDLALKKNYSVRACAGHACMMNSLSNSYLANSYPKTTFIHMYPGIIRTNIMSGIGAPKWIENGMFILMAPFLTSLPEAGERHLYAATSKTFQTKEQGGDSKAEGSYRLSNNNDPVKDKQIFTTYKADGMAEKIWSHTLDVFKKVVDKGEKWE